MIPVFWYGSVSS